MFAGFVYFTIWDEPLLSDFAAGLTASFLVIVFVEGALEEERREERLRVAQVALALLKRPVSNMFSMLAGWYKASLEEPVKQVPSTMEMVFNEEFYEALVHFDIHSPAPVLPARNWLAWSSEQCAQFRTDLGEVIGKYATFLTPRQIELAENAAQSSVVSLVQLLNNVPMTRIYASLNVAPPTNLLLFKESTVQVREFVESLLSLRDELAAAGIEAGTVSNLRLDDPKNPPVGTGRVE